MAKSRTLLPTPPEACGFMERIPFLRMYLNPGPGATGNVDKDEVLLICKTLMLLTRLFVRDGIPPIMPKWLV